MGLGAAALKLIQTVFYLIAWCCSVVIVAIYAYFLSLKSNREIEISGQDWAITIISAAAVVYTLFAVILTCCLGGKNFFAFLAIIIDILFFAGFIVIIILTRHGAGSCSGYVRTPLGDGESSYWSPFAGGQAVPNRNDGGLSPRLGTACRLNTVSFAVAIIGAFFFLLAALFHFWLRRHAQREKRFGPSPANGYTAGSGNKWFARRRRGHHTTKDAELATVGAGALAAPHHGHHGHHNRDSTYRQSHDTAYTGTTAAPEGTYIGNKYESHPTVPAAGGYTHTAPGVNPYGYDNTRTNAHNY